MLPIKVPPLGESIVEATVSKWHKKEGDVVAAGDTIVELDTDKITVEVPALKPGVIAKRVKNEGDVVKVDEVLGELDEAAGGADLGAAWEWRGAGRARDAREDDHAPQEDRGEPAAIAEGDGAPHHIQRSRHERGNRAAREVSRQSREGIRRQADLHALLR